jgi:hypothetical protein
LQRLIKYRPDPLSTTKLRDSWNGIATLEIVMNPASNPEIARPPAVTQTRGAGMAATQNVGSHPAMAHRYQEADA